MAADTPSATVIDLQEYRRRRLEARAVPRQRRFLWSWPASGHAVLVDFAARVATPSTARSYSV